MIPGSVPYGIEHPLHKITRAVIVHMTIVSKTEVDIEKAIDEVSMVLNSADNSEVSIICSGNNDLEEIEAIKGFETIKSLQLEESQIGKLSSEYINYKSNLFDLNMRLLWH